MTSLAACISGFFARGGRFSTYSLADVIIVSRKQIYAYCIRFRCYNLDFTVVFWRAFVQFASQSARSSDFQGGEKVRLTRTQRGLSDKLLCTLQPLEPAYPVLCKVLDCRLEDSFVQCEIVNGAGPKKATIGSADPSSVHERPACFAEEVGHGVAGGDGVGLSVDREVVLATEMFEM